MTEIKLVDYLFVWVRRKGRSSRSQNSVLGVDLAYFVEEGQRSLLRTVSLDFRARKNSWKAEFAGLLEGRILVGFDIRPFLGWYRSQSGEKAPMHLCLEKLSRSLDAQSIRQFENLMEDHPGILVMEDFLELSRMDGFEDALRPLQKKPSLPALLRVEDLDNVPESPGVYYFYNERGEVLYVGKSIALRSRVLSHFQADQQDHKEFKIVRELSGFQIKETTGELEALLLEAQEIKRLQPKYNRKLRRVTNPVYLSYYKDSDGYLSFDLDYELSESKSTLIQFPSRKRARTFLQNLVGKAQACFRLSGLESGTGACFGYQLSQCKGACLGLESSNEYNSRLAAHLDLSQDSDWIFGQTVALREKNLRTRRVIYHLVHQGIYLKTVKDRRSFKALPAMIGSAKFEWDLYKILRSYFSLGGKFQKKHFEYEIEPIDTIAGLPARSADLKGSTDNAKICPTC